MGVVQPVQLGAVTSVGLMSENIQCSGFSLGMESGSTNNRIRTQLKQNVLKQMCLCDLFPN